MTSLFLVGRHRGESVALDRYLSWDEKRHNDEKYNTTESFFDTEAYMGAWLHLPQQLTVDGAPCFHGVYANMVASEMNNGLV